MKNVNIGTRLALGFGTLSVMLVILIVLGITMLSRVNSGTIELVENRIPAIDMSSRIESHNSIIAISLRNMMLNDDAADREAQTILIAKSRAVMDETLGQLKGMLLGDQAQRILGEMAVANTDYQNGQEQLVKYIVAGEDDLARAYLTNELRPRLARLRAATGEQIALQKLGSKEAAAAAADTYATSKWLMGILGAIALTLAVVVAWAISRSITRPVARALEVANTVAAGDLTSQIEVTSRDETGQLLQALKTMNDNLARTVGTVRTGTDTIAVAAAQVAAGSQDLSSRTEQQAGALEETASSMEELTSTVKQNADNARQANVLAESASTVAARGGNVIGQVVGTMNEINASASKISDIIGVIDGIAFQTNILALNAAVEAARAGEQGRGFAVVASEVRNLAQRSAAAAKEIKSLIGDSTGKVAAGSKLVAEAGATMGEIVESVRRVTDIMSEISAASQEQTAGIEQINQAVVQMDEGTQQNAALVEEAAAASASMQEQAGKLAQAMAFFRVAGGQAEAALNTAQRAPTVSAPRSPPALTARKPASAMLGKTPVRDAEWAHF